MNFTSNKKEKEYKILKKIFNKHKIIKESETPDFIIDNTIGVEITSFYHSKVSAILSNNSDFREEVCQNASFKNKEFLKDAPFFVSFESNFCDITPKKNVLVTNHPEKIKDIIIKKDKLDYYKNHPNLKSINLIIQDEEHLLIIADDFIKDIFFIIELIACEEVFNTQFNKIYFIICSHDNEYYFNIEETTFFILCHLFNHFYLQYTHLKQISWANIIEQFKSFCSEFGINKIENNYSNTIIKYKEYEFEIFKSFKISYGKCLTTRRDIKQFIEYVKDNISDFKINFEDLKIIKVIKANH